MTADVRRYLWLRVTVLGTSLAMFASLVIAAIQFWPIVHRLIAPVRLACGCAVVSVATSWWLTTIALTVVCLTVLLFGWSATQFLRQLRRSRRQERFIRAEAFHVLEFENHRRLYVVETQNVYAVTIGFWQPRIYVSRGLIQQLSTSELGAVLAHERAHQRFCDPLVTALLQVCSSVFGWLPGARNWMTAAYSLRELAADAIATNGYQSTTDLSSAFLKLSHLAVQPASIAFSPNRDRLEKLLNRHWTPTWRWWKWSAGVVAGVFIVMALTLGHLASAKSPAIPPSASAFCHETIVMCQNKHLPALPSSFVCADGRCAETRYTPLETPLSMSNAQMYIKSLHSNF